MYKLSEYALRWWERIQSDRTRRGKAKLVNGQGWKRCLLSTFNLLNCDELLSYIKQDYYWPRSSYLNCFEEPYIPPLKEELHVEENIVLEDYVEVKEQNIEIS